ncbi:hypothetical protein T06_11918 [Trichinella sp. T6]|nr:hypothetical protein T06_11918 [Trichinella sp. T6]
MNSIRLQLQRYPFLFSAKILTFILKGNIFDLT